MDARLETLRQQYELGEMSEAIFRQQLDLLIPALPTHPTWWQRFQHWQAQQRVRTDQRAYEYRRAAYQQEQAEKAAFDAAIEAWQEAYAQLAKLLPKHDHRRLLPPLDPRLISIMEASPARERRIQMQMLQKDVQQIIWDLERMDKLASSPAPIRTPEDALARLK